VLSERCYTPAVFQTEAGAGYFLGKQLAEVGGVGLAELVWLGSLGGNGSGGVLADLELLLSRGIVGAVIALVGIRIALASPANSVFAACYLKRCLRIECLQTDCCCGIFKFKSCMQPKTWTSLPPALPKFRVFFGWRGGREKYKILKHASLTFGYVGVHRQQHQPIDRIKSVFPNLYYGRCHLIHGVGGSTNCNFGEFWAGKINLDGLDG